MVDTFLDNKIFDIYVRDSSNKSKPFYDVDFFMWNQILGNRVRLFNKYYDTIIMRNNMSKFKKYQGTFSIELGKFEPPSIRNRPYDYIPENI